MDWRRLHPSGVLAVVGLLTAAAGSGWADTAPCPMEWKPGFGVPGIGTGSFYDGVYALCIFDDDGDGPNPPALYAGGDFYTAGDAFAQNIARWDGTKWSALAGRISGTVYALCVYDDGTGPALFVGGAFSFYDDTRIWNIAKWDGANWSYIGSVPGYVYSLAVFDDGAGPALYVGGQFTQTAGVPVKHIARWDGSTWSALGSGIYSFDFTPQVRALAVYDDGSGPALYVGGHFSQASGVTAYNIAKWNGSNWSPVGAGVGGYSLTKVNALALFDDGRGPALYAGGLFRYARQVEADNIARWDGASWSALASGTDNTVRALCAFDDGSGPALYVGGKFWHADGLLVCYMAEWDGATFQPVSTGVWGFLTNSEGVHALTLFAGSSPTSPGRKRS